jgi:release factor glutamine methyltransferase
VSRLSEHLAQAAATLRAAGIEDGMRDARALLAHATGIAPDRLTLHLQDQGAADQLAHFEAMILRRARRVPVSHLIGSRLFWGRSFQVSADVLDPRPETESLIAAALAAPFARVLDLGLGSGAILLTLLAERPAAVGQGVELSPAALAVAQSNAHALGLSARADLRLGSWFDPVVGRFDLIVSNPPYIAAAEMEGLAPEVRLHEPHLALTPGGDGLDAYRAIAAGCLDHLAPEGRILVEIGPKQAAEVAGLFEKAGLTAVKVLQDMDGRDRVILARAP